MTAEHRLITYGTLAPGRVNHGQISHLSGNWREGVVRGTLIEEGWGADHGCPGIRLHAEGEAVRVFVFESIDLPNHWQRLDAFEGHEYRRTQAIVEMDDESVEGCIYELSE